MPTIKQLPAATSVGATDLLPLSQGGTTKSLAVGSLLSSVQSAISLAPSKLLGRVSSSAGGPEPVGLGAGLAIAAGSLAATGSDHTQLPTSTGLLAGDEVIINTGGLAKRMSASLLRSLFVAGSGVSIDGSGTISAAGGGGSAGVLTFNQRSGPITLTSADVQAAGGALSAALPGAGTVAPSADGAAAVGVSTLYARQDHVHPTDGTRLAVASNLSDVANAGVARANLGLGGAALLAVGTVTGTVAAGDDARIVGALSSASAASTYLPVAGIAAGAFIASGGTGARTLAARAGDRLSVLDFGVVGDGVADDSVALAAAAAALRGTGRALYIPQGVKVRLAGAAQVWLSGVRIVADGVRELGAAGQTAYGQRGGSILVDSTGSSPFVVSSDWGFEGVTVFWPRQTEAAAVANGGAPVAYPALAVPHVTAGTADGVQNWHMVGCQVVNAYDVLDFTAAQGVGDYHFSRNLVFALRYVLRLNKAGGEGFVADNQVTPEAYNYGTLGTGTTNLLSFYTLNGTFLQIEGTGTPSTASALAVEGMRLAGNYVFAARYGLHVVGGNYNVCSWTANTFDQVPNPICVEAGGAIRADVTGGRIISGRLNDPSLVTTAISVSGGAPGSYLALNGVELESASGSGVVFQDPGAGLLAITGGKLASIGQASNNGSYDGVLFDCAGGSLRITGTLITDTNAASEHLASGVVVVHAASSTVAGVTLGGWAVPYTNVTTAGVHSLVGCTSTGTAAAGGAAAVAGAGVVSQAGNSWDVGPNYPTAPTAVAGTSTTQVASTAFVQAAVQSSGVRVTSGASYAMSAGDRYVVIKKAVGSATAIVLPASPVSWLPYVVKDGGGDASTNVITVSGGAPIDGSGSFVMNQSWESVTLIFNGVDWSVI